MYTKHELTHIFDDYGLLRQHMKKQEFIDYLAERTPFLEPTAKTKQRLWHVINDIGGLVSCLGCDKNVKWKSKDGGIGYSRFCSSKCSQRNPGVQLAAVALKETGPKPCLTTIGWKGCCGCPTPSRSSVGWGGGSTGPISRPTNSRWSRRCWPTARNIRSNGDWEGSKANR